MTYKLWQKKLELKQSDNIIDIIQFGSSIYSDEPNDLDIAVIFKKIPLKEQLNEAQKIKMKLEKYSEIPIHISAYDYYSLLEEGNFALRGILNRGISIITGKYFSESFGFTPIIEISYSLKNLEKKDKIKFNYTISGKGNNYGLLKKYGGELIAPGIIRIKPEFEKIFSEKLSKQANIMIKNILIEKD